MSLERGMLVLLLIWTVMDFGVGYSMGKHAGYERALQDVKPVAQPNIDQQCVKWLFDNNLKEARQRMCGGKK